MAGWDFLAWVVNVAAVIVDVADVVAAVSVDAVDVAAIAVNVADVVEY